ncbi:MAG: hypothetical protein MK160_00760 [Rhodobacteraceae bacterium]|nr:hypothetical protein [Paracoccaceae bacterium]
MRLVSLTSIPPRFSGLGPVLESLLAQRPAPDLVVLAVPRRFHRFQGDGLWPTVPEGVTLLPCEDHGPATKVIAARAAYPGAQIIYCDDDCVYGAGWLDALSDVPGPVAAASIFEGQRVGLPGVTVAQGFAGVRVDADVALPTHVPNPVLFADDLYLSSCFAGQHVQITASPIARMAVRPIEGPEGLQDLNRPRAYKQAVTWLNARASAHRK